MDKQYAFLSRQRIQRKACGEDCSLESRFRGLDKHSQAGRGDRTLADEGLRRVEGGAAPDASHDGVALFWKQALVSALSMAARAWIEWEELFKASELAVVLVQARALLSLTQRASFMSSNQAAFEAGRPRQQPSLYGLVYRVGWEAERPGSRRKAKFSLVASRPGTCICFLPRVLPVFHWTRALLCFGKQRL